ncbi:M12 family metallopeptidase [Pseudomonas fluorescens]|jgi:hypothetical protein|uniref:M12 family metallopeptidase n=1 Tax=Pseudomonas fluorescens TaxID=294 RepID=UPI00054BBBFC|nr:M12 family metallopeptidase [Pseudomonas fluorescens]KII29526.1 peptidase M12 [Pseudomonas fluorescens]
MQTIKPCHIQSPPSIQASYEAAITENPENASSTSSGRGKRAVGEHNKYWLSGRTLKIAITDYEDGGFEIVKNAISQWQPYVNLKFEFTKLTDERYEGDIRIDLAPQYDTVASSAIGTDALTVLAHLPTMGLGVEYTSTSYEGTVIHEFGHALGFAHEHQHPDADIPWHKENTYQFYQQNYGWSKAAVDNHVFPLPRRTDRTYTPYDRHSVMHYPIINTCTVGDWEQADNLQISAGDKALARAAYP